MDPSELPGMFEGIITRVEATAARAAVDAMSRTYQRAVKYTLSLRTNAMDAFTEKNNLPPALRSGDLRKSVTRGPVTGVRPVR